MHLSFSNDKILNKVSCNYVYNSANMRTSKNSAFEVNCVIPSGRGRFLVVNFLMQFFSRWYGEYFSYTIIDCKNYRIFTMLSSALNNMRAFLLRFAGISLKWSEVLKFRQKTFKKKHQTESNFVRVTLALSQ